MKILLITVWLAVSSVAFAQSDKSPSGAVQQVDALERQRFTAQISKDFGFLEKVFADDLIYTHSNGKVDTKTTYLNSIREGKSIYEKIDVEGLTIRPYNNDQTAVVNGIITITQPPVDGKPKVSHLRYAVVYIKDPKKGWQLVLWQSVKLASE